MKTLVIYGPTSTGKTALALKLAKKYNGEIISADSRQVYQKLDIGSGKLSLEKLKDPNVKKSKGLWVVDKVKIHGFDLVKPQRSFSAADFYNFATAKIEEMTKKGKLPIVVGGTGFYIKVLIDGIGSIGIKPNKNLRSKLEKLSVTDLYQKLLNASAIRAQSMNKSDRANPRRLIRAVEVALSNQKSIENSRPRLDSIEDGLKFNLPAGKAGIENYLLIGLTAPNSYLYNRYNKWLDKRLAHGLLNEVRELLNNNINPQWFDNLGLEYRWITRYLKGQIPFLSAEERLKGDVHSFIRRQKTWFKQFKYLNLFDISKPSWQKELEKKIKIQNI